MLKVAFTTCGMQLVSSGNDGLVKVWTIRTNECVTTLDGHMDKVSGKGEGQEGEGKGRTGWMAGRDCSL